jgi:putative oxidoreductase
MTEDNTWTRLERAAAHRGPTLLRISLGIVFAWFALPKFVPGLSPMSGLAVDTVTVLSYGTLTGDVARILVAVLETAIAVGLLTGRLPRLTLAALLGHLVGTLAPLVLFTGRTWQGLLVPSLEGQFILKNLVFAAAAVTVAGARHAGRRT